MAAALALAFYTLAAFGLAYILGHSRITLYTRTRLAALGWFSRWMVELVECPACLGTWLGFAAGFFWPHLAPLGWAPLALALWTCGANYLLGRATGLLKE